MNIETLRFNPREKISATDPTRPMFSSVDLSQAFGKTAHELSRVLESMIERMEVPSRNLWLVGKLSGRSVEEALYDSLAAAKIITSKLSMHLEDAWRRRLFEKLDELLDAENWQDGDAPLSAASFETYLRFHLFVRPINDPSFGISNAGNLLGGWLRDRNRLTMEFLPQDSLRWALIRHINDERESAAAQVSIHRVLEVLKPFDSDFWFGHGVSSNR